MGIFRPREQLRIVSPTFDWLLEGLKFAFLPVAIVSVGYGFIFQIAAFVKGLHVLAVYGASVVALCAVYILFIQTTPARQLLDGLATEVRRVVIISCTGASKRLGSAWTYCGLACSELRRPRVSYPDQQAVVEQLVETLNAAIGGKTNFSIVLGESGCGKTSVAFELAAALIRNRKLSSLAGRILYYDLGEGERTEAVLLRHLGGARHWDCVVIVDNFHRASAQTLRALTQVVLDGAGSAAERCLVLLAQPPKTWKAVQGGEARILSGAKAQGRLFNLRGVSRDTIQSDDLSDAFKPVLERISKLNRERIASVAKLQVLQMRPQQGSDVALLDAVVSLLEARLPGGDAKRASVASAIGVACALAVQRGSFTLRSYVLAAAWAARAHRSGVLKTAQLIFVLFRLARLGIMPRTSLPGQLFVFHEALVPAFRRALVSEPAFEEAFQAAFRWRLEAGTDRRDPTLQWIGACEIASVDGMATWFERALLAGGLFVMVAHLEPNLVRMGGSVTAAFQLGVLLDRCGRFSEARRYFEVVSRNVRSDDALFSNLVLAEVEAAHGDDSEVRLRTVLAGGRPEAVIAAKYWLIHLDAHHGSFAPKALLALAEEMTSRFASLDISSTYNLTYLGSRVLFDACRQAFLSEVNPITTLTQVQLMPLGALLRRSYPQYRAMTLLYMKAHVLGHLLLPTCAVEGRIDHEAAAFLNLEASKLNSETLLTLTRAAYREAKDEFSISGDRESFYLDADLLNADLCDPRSNLDDLQPRLYEYEAFIRESKFADIASYPQFYWFRWHVAKRFRLLEGEGPTAADIDWHDGEARRRLDLVESCDRASNNPYGLWRCQLYRTLLACLSAKDGGRAVSKLHDLRDEAVRSGYARDAAMVEAVVGSGKVALLKVRQSLLFHPFVHQ